MSNKWEREIEELLRKKFPEDKSGKPGPTPLPRPAPQDPGPQRDWMKSVRDWSPERMMLVGLGLALSVYLLRPVLGPLTIVLVLAAVGLIAGSVVLSILNREQPPVEKRWRGRIIELPRQRAARGGSGWRRFWYKLKRWLRIRGG